MSDPPNSSGMSGDLDDSVFRSLEFALMVGAPELTYQNGMQVLERSGSSARPRASRTSSYANSPRGFGRTTSCRGS